MPNPVGTVPQYDAYQQWKAEQRQAELAQLAAGNGAMSPTQDGFNMSNDTMDEMQVSKAFSLENAPAPVEPMEQMQVANQFSVGNSMQPLATAQVQPAAISAGDGGASAGSMAGAGIAAAGQAVSIIAQIAGQQAAKEQMIASNEKQRESSEKMARAALLQNQSQFDQTSQGNAYQSMLSMFGAAGNQTMQQRALKRANEQNRGEGLTTAFLGA